MTSLVFLRHGQSEWNRDHRFTGWSDVGLTATGIAECETAGRALAAAGHRFDVCFTSVLARGIDAARATLQALRTPELELQQTWRLNERHFGALQGMSRSQAIRAYGLLPVLRLQRSYSLRPPPLRKEDPRFPGHDPLYAELSEKELPKSESLAETYVRVVPYWHGSIVPSLRLGRSVLIVAHKNSLRVLAKLIESLPESEVPKLELPTGQPLVYEFDRSLNLLRREFLAPRRRTRPLWRLLSPA